jgi:hypothetical protein
MALPAVNIAVMQPSGYLHSLGFLDQARYFRYQFRRLGASVSISKNRLREDAVNFVFGAHLGFSTEPLRRNACIFVNLEQLGAGGAAVSPHYIDLLRNAAVVDYDALNVPSYASDTANVPIVPFLHAPYLSDGHAQSIASRPIDLLFFGSMNDRRKALIERIESCGVQVALFDRPLYGPERDAYVLQSKAVLNCPYYESSRFEQARVFQVLSLGTPVISERTPATVAHEAFRNAVFWFDDRSIEDFFRNEFRSEAFVARADSKLDGFRAHDPVDAYAELLAFAEGFHRGFGSTRAPGPWRPRNVNLGSGRDYRQGWLNVDIEARTEPDLILDLTRPLELPLLRPTRGGSMVLLEESTLERVYASNVLEHVSDLPALMTNLLALLADGGTLDVEVPYEKSPTAWQDPTHVRAMNENSWIYYTDWFWYLGWFEHRFEVAASQWLDMNLQPCEQSAAGFMRVTLRKVSTSPYERSVARAMRPDFGGLPADPVSFEPIDTDDRAQPRSDVEVDSAELTRRIHAMLGSAERAAAPVQP